MMTPVSCITCLAGLEEIRPALYYGLLAVSSDQIGYCIFERVSHG